MTEQEIECEVNKAPRTKWFGRGIYGSKDVPIRVLNGVIAGLCVIAVVLTIIFSINGGYRVTFDTNGGSEVKYQELRYGKLVEEPEAPTKPGYIFNGWSSSAEENEHWSFTMDKVSGDTTLYAQWKPVSFQVKFDLNGGTYMGSSEVAPIEVTYGEKYGDLPTPTKEGAIFLGWLYSGANIGSDTIVSMTGEHVLTAVWE